MKSLTTILAALALGTTVSFAADEAKPAEKPAGDKPAATAEKPAAPGAEKPKRNPEEVFKKLDANNDGSVSLDEFKAGPMGKKDPVKAEEIFKRKDANNDGKLTVDEFKAGGHGPEKKKKEK